MADSFRREARVIYGPPGTGKTHRLVGLAREFRTKGEQVLFLTFTRAAANELRARVGTNAGLGVSTLHAFVIERVGMSQAIINKPWLDKLAAILGGGASFKGDVEDFEEATLYDQYRQIFIESRNTFEDVRIIYNRHGSPGSFEDFTRFVSIYEEWKNANFVYDFDDALQDYLRYPLAPGYSVILVDEAQDLTPLQWKVIRLLYERVKVLIVAGDDDQAIYEWRGARPSSMFEFEEWSKASREVLAQSYRIPRVVHAYSQRLIQQVDERVQKEFKPRDEEGTIYRHVGLDGVNTHWDPQGRYMFLCRDRQIVRKVSTALRHSNVPHIFPALELYLGSATGQLVRIAHDWETTSNDERAFFVRELSRRLKKVLTEKEAREFDISAFIPRGLHAGLRMYFSVPDIRVRVKTIHGAKGLEEDNVVVLGARHPLTAKMFAIRPDPEHRLNYVAVTRARHCLHIVDSHDPYPFPGLE